MSGTKFTSDFFIKMFDIDAMSTQGWKDTTLSYLYHSLYHASLCDTTNVFDFISLLQIGELYTCYCLIGYSFNTNNKNIYCFVGVGMGAY